MHVLAPLAIPSEFRPVSRLGAPSQRKWKAMLSDRTEIVVAEVNGKPIILYLQSNRPTHWNVSYTRDTKIAAVIASNSSHAIGSNKIVGLSLGGTPEQVENAAEIGMEHLSNTPWLGVHK